MKIRNIKCRAVAAPMKRPLATSVATLTASALLLIDLETDQFVSQSRKPFHFQVSRSDLYYDVLAIEIPEFAESLTECVEGGARLSGFKRSCRQEANSGHLPGLLRLHGKRPRGR